MVEIRKGKKISREMLEAGVLALVKYNDDFESPEDAVERIWFAMIEVIECSSHSSRSAAEAEREAIKAIVADHAAWGRSFGVEDICDKIIAAINARSEREGYQPSSS